ncbi:type II secretion system GspH family protein [Patescibacteria group bacterium AH-259-L07]|nr:type II secretion system GspH family protein [Patescibacteria group bacterium AH-259-L07]
MESHKAFTLIEILLYTAIIGVIVVSFVTFSISISDSKNKAYVATEVQENARMALKVISQKIRAADDVDIGASVFGSDPGVLSLSMADASRNPTIIELDSDNGSLQITEGVNNPVQITTNRVNVTNLVFTNVTPSNVSRESIHIQITVAYNNASGDIEYTYSQSLQTAVSLRQ